MMIIRTCTVAGALICVGLAQSASANLFSNPGFELPITFDGPPFVGSWEGFSGGGTASSGNLSLMPRTGAMHLGLSITNSANNFAGAFQDVPGLSPGEMVSFSGWHKTTTSPFNVGVEIRIEWRNSVTNLEVARTPNFTPVPTDTYGLFSLDATVPVGADLARVVYAIQTFNPTTLNNGDVFIDDVSFIPAPTTFALAMGGMGMIGLRRRRA